VDFPASSPFALACGGTQLEASESVIIREVVWNQLANGNGATGGGVSEESGIFPLPSWQVHLGVPPSANNGLSGRGLPDVAANADPHSGYLVHFNGNSAVVGGTGAAAALWSGLIARINQLVGRPLGYINPFLAYYASNPIGFHNITLGNNGAYHAGPGWNACTGLGTPAGSQLAALFAFGEKCEVVAPFEAQPGWDALTGLSQPSGTQLRTSFETENARTEGLAGVISEKETRYANLPLADLNATRVRVFYATDRKELRANNLEIRYGWQKSPHGQIHYGECEVSIPKIHKLGKLESPSILKFEFRPDPKKHVLLAKLESFEEQEFLNRVASSIAKSDSRDAFIFIHGYNVSFEDAARRTGQIAFDLNFIGAPIFYSWPSGGRITRYFEDEAKIIWSTPHFEHFLSLLAHYSGAARIYVIAHSMGSRAVCDALKTLSIDPACRFRLTHLILAAPDIDADTFRELSDAVKKLSRWITLYESTNDKALKASKEIHGDPRAGEPLLIVPGLDAVDASAIDTDFLGHSYFSDSWPLLSDIHSILSKDEPPAKRFGLVEMEHTDGKFYVFKP
jgi:esterase/lipase superfamily enzyme